MQSDMNIPNKFLSFEEDAFCKFYSSHANDKSLELREKISKNLSVLRDNDINDLEFTDAGDIKLREKGITDMKDQGDQSARFQKNATDIEKFVKFIGDFRGIINKGDAALIKIQLMTSVSSPFLESSVKNPLVNAGNVIQEKFINAPQTGNVKADFKSLLLFKRFITANLKTLDVKKDTSTLNNLKEQLEKVELNDKGVFRRTLRICALVAPFATLGFMTPLTIFALIWGPAVFVVLGAIFGAVVIGSAITLVTSFFVGDRPYKSSRAEELEADVDELNKRLKSADALSKINEDIEKDSERFTTFCDRYETFSPKELINGYKKSRSFFNLYYYSRINDALQKADDVFLTIEEKQTKDIKENNEKIATLEKELGLKRRAV